MMRKSFFGLSAPRLQYASLGPKLRSPRSIPTPPKVTLHLVQPSDQHETLALKVGDAVKTGQKIGSNDNGHGVLCTVTGTVAGLSPFIGHYGQTYTAIDIEVASKEEFDDQFAAACQAPELVTAAGFLADLPGSPPWKLLADPDQQIHTVVVCGVDDDLLVSTRQYALKTAAGPIKKGIAILKELTGVERFVIAAPQDLGQEAVSTKAEVSLVSADYPSALPEAIMKDHLDTVVPEDKTPADLGVCFISAEAVAAIGKAYDQGQVPAEKIITLIRKDGSRTLVAAKIGTPIGRILQAGGVKIKQNDRIVLGGPMRGVAIYSEELPVRPDTDAIMVQGSADVPLVLDEPCINCGQCVRVCPVKMQVNMLVRFLAARQYEAGAAEYDLNCCIECGLCTYVCVSRIPIFQYIRLAKYELARITAAEEAHA